MIMTTRKKQHVSISVGRDQIDNFRSDWSQSHRHIVIRSHKGPYCIEYKTLGFRLLYYIDFIMTTMASHITSQTIVYSTVYSGADKKKHQSSASLALCGEFTGTGEFPAQRASNAENVFIWWHHHGVPTQSGAPLIALVKQSHIQ